MGSKSFLSAVVVIPPEEIWHPIQAIRKQYDKAYNTWMPHINLLFPFLENDAAGIHFVESAQYLSECLPKEIQSFKVQFTKDSIRYFDHGGKCSVHLRPLMVDTEEECNKRKKLEKLKKTSEVKTQSKKAAEQKKAASRTTRGEQGESTQLQDQVSTPASERNVSTTQNTVDLTKKEIFKIVQIKPVPPVPAEYQDLPPASLSSLKDAVWKEFDLPVKADHISPGLDCLRYANWSPENKRQVQFMENKKSEFEVVKSVQVIMDSQSSTVTVDRPPKHCEQENSLSSSESSSSGDEETDDDDGMTVVSSSRRRRRRPPARSPGPEETPDLSKALHVNLKYLQSTLEALYPQFNEQSSKSASGYQPHLTLGQTEKRNVSKFVADLKRGWKDVTFDVKEVHLISRQGKPSHEVCQSVQLGD